MTRPEEEIELLRAALKKMVVLLNAHADGSAHCDCHDCIEIREAQHQVGYVLTLRAGKRTSE